MKVFNFFHKDQIRLGVDRGEVAIDVARAAAELKQSAPLTMQELLEGGNPALRALDKLFAAKSASLDPAQLNYAPAVTQPEKILCVGLNYQDHVTEANLGRPEFPALFSKFSNALAAHGQVIAIPAATRQCDYEAELVIIIGKTAVNVSQASALDYVFGYTVGNDLSARDLQRRTSQWLLGKTPDNFAPIGPQILCAVGINPNELAIESRVNGQLRQSSNTRKMIFSCAAIVSYISQHMTLKPGDIIFTGTPEGVILGYPPEKQIWLKSGDEITVTIEKIGTLTNTLR